METIILVLIGAIAGGAIVNMMYVCKEGKNQETRSPKAFQGRSSLLPDCSPHKFQGEYDPANALR